MEVRLDTYYVHLFLHNSLVHVHIDNFSQLIFKDYIHIIIE